MPYPDAPKEGISTHAPRTGSDAELLLMAFPTSHFNPRSPHGERPFSSAFAAALRVFQPTLPARGATPAKMILYSTATFQPTLPARGATISGERSARTDAISTHAPRTGSDARPKCHLLHQFAFQPTLPARGATKLPELLEIIICISTHAPRTGSDSADRVQHRYRTYFNPRSPHGERQSGFYIEEAEISISTHAPRTGSDPPTPAAALPAIISTHAPRTGSDG